MKLLTLILASTIVFAQETIVLKEITITSAPFQREVLFVNQLENTDNNEHAERAVQIQETTPGFRQPIYRGLQGDQINLTVDEMDFTNSLFRSGPNQYYSYIPNEFVQDISLNKGVDDISNNSFGGSINRHLGFLESNSNTIQIQNYINGGKVFTSFQDEDLKLGAIYEDKRSVVTPDGEQAHTNYNQKGIYLEKNRYKLIYTRSDEIDRTDKFLKGEPRIYDKQYYLGFFKDFMVNQDYILKISYQNFYENVNNPRNGVEKIDKSNNNIYQIRNEYYFSDELIMTTKHKFEDIEYQKYNKDKKNYDVIDNSIALNYFENYKDFKYSASVIADYATIADKNFWNVGVGVKGEYKGIYLSIAQGYKYPTIYNLNEAVSDSLYEIPNPDLKKETSIKTEIGYTARYQNFKYKGTMFYNILEDMITREKTYIVAPDGSDMFQVTNAENGYTYGANTNLVYESNKFIIDFFAEYVYGRTNIDYISKITPFRTDTRIEYYGAGVTHKFAKESTTLSEADKADIRIKEHNYGYNQFDVYYKYKFSKDYIKVSVKNITNDTGRVLGSGTDFEERHIYIKLVMKI